MEKRDRSKLPKWAQDELRRLELEAADLREAMSSAQSGRPDSPVQVIDTVHKVQFGLDNVFTTIRVQIGDDHFQDGRPRWYVDLRREGRRLHVHGSDRLVAALHSSNLLYIDVADRYEEREDASKRDLGERLLNEALGRGLGWQNALDLIDAAPSKGELSNDDYRRLVRSRVTR